MKKMFVFAVAVFMAGVFAVHAAEAKTGDDLAVRLKLASKLLKIMDVGKAMTQSFESIKQMQSSMTKQMVKNAKDQQLAIKNQHKIMDLMQKELSWEKLRPEFEKLYAETYSLEELNGLIKFYESPVGKKFIQKQPEMQRKSMLMMQQLIMKIMPKIQALTKAMREEMIAAKKAKKSDIKSIIESENHFYASQGYMVGKFIGKNIPGAKVLVIENRNFQKSKREIAFIAALKNGLGRDDVKAVALTILNPPKGEPKPIMEIMTSKDFNAVISANSDKNVLVSLIGLPRDAAKMKLWRMSAAKRPKLILAGGAKGGSIKLEPALKRGMISAVVVISPKAKFDEQGVPENFENAFKKRYLLIHKNNISKARELLRKL